MAAEIRVIEKLKQYRANQKRFTIGHYLSDHHNKQSREISDSTTSCRSNNRQQNNCTKDHNNYLTDENADEEHRFNSALSTLLAENSWQLVTSRTGRYKVHFRKSLAYVDRISILGIVLEDIRERYHDTKANLQQLKREKYSRTRRKLRRKMRSKAKQEENDGMVPSATEDNKLKREKVRERGS